MTAFLTFLCAEGHENAEAMAVGIVIESRRTYEEDVAGIKRIFYGRFEASIQVGKTVQKCGQFHFGIRVLHFDLHGFKGKGSRIFHFNSLHWFQTSQPLPSHFLCRSILNPFAARLSTEAENHCLSPNALAADVSAAERFHASMNS